MRCRNLRRWLAWGLLAGAPLLLVGCDQAASSDSDSPNPASPQPAAAESATDVASTEKSPAESASPAVPKPARAATTKDVTFDTIKLDMEKGDPFERSLLTPEVEALVDRPIRIRGYILPSFQQSGLTQFVLVRDNMECCFGPGAALYDCIIVEMKPGKSTDFSVRPVTVEGTFAVRELFDPDGKHLAIYHLSGEKVN